MTRQLKEQQARFAELREAKREEGRKAAQEAQGSAQNGTGAADDSTDSSSDEE